MGCIGTFTAKQGVQQTYTYPTAFSHGTLYLSFECTQPTTGIGDGRASAYTDNLPTATGFLWGWTNLGSPRICYKAIGY